MTEYSFVVFDVFDAGRNLCGEDIDAGRVPV